VSMSFAFESARSVRLLSSVSRMTGTEGRGSGAGEIGQKGVAQPRQFAKGASDDRPLRLAPCDAAPPN
jgi:hypothetical protein